MSATAGRSAAAARRARDDDSFTRGADVVVAAIEAAAREGSERAMSAFPDEQAMFERGLIAPPPQGPARDRVMLIACGALGRALDALRRREGWTHVDLDCAPAKLHNLPERIPETVRIRARAARARGYGRIVVVYGDCGTAGRLDAVCLEEGVERVPGPHCAALHLGPEAFEAVAESEPGAFYATDFFVRCFDALIWRGMGLGRHPELREMLFAHHDRLVHLAQEDDPRLDAAARLAAQRLGLAHERRLVGFGGLSATLAPFVAAAPAR